MSISLSDAKKEFIIKYKKNNSEILGAGVNEKENSIVVYITKNNVKTLPSTLYGFDIDYYTSEPYSFLRSNRDCWALHPESPYVGGVSVGNERKTSCYTGTGGFIGVEKIPPYRRLLFSNNHVLACINTDTTTYANIGDPIYIPGILDEDRGGMTRVKIGTLLKYVAFKTTSDINNKVYNYADVAIAEITEPFYRYLMKDCTSVIHINGINTSPQAGDKIKKSGRTSNYTEGNIVSTKYDGATVGLPGNTFVYFNDLITVSTDGIPGDSGSCVVDYNNKIIGILFAGGGTENHALICKIQNILLELGYTEDDIDFTTGLDPVPDWATFVDYGGLSVPSKYYMCLEV